MKGKKIADGRTAEIYAWKAEEVVKLFHAWVPQNDIHYEFNLAKKIHSLGVSTPGVGEIVESDGRKGFTMERVHGITLADAFFKKPFSVFRSAKVMAGLHFELHRKKALSEIKTTNDRLTERVNRAKALPDEYKLEIIKKLKSAENGNRLCHNDFHPYNILVGKNGSYIIDWIDVTSGAPGADFARTMILLEGSLHNDKRGFFQKSLLKIFISAYRKHYLRLNPQAKDDYAFWRPIAAAASMNEDTDSHSAWLLDQVKSGIS